MALISGRDENIHGFNQQSLVGIKDVNGKVVYLSRPNPPGSVRKNFSGVAVELSLHDAIVSSSADLIKQGKV
jgi:hypothetical protein